jgi:hypothetical protein
MATSGFFNDDKIIVLALEAGAEKFAAPVRSNRPQTVWKTNRAR